jgi:hypothetical protein
VDRLLGRTEADHQVLRCELVERATTAAPRAPEAPRRSLLDRLLRRA